MNLFRRARTIESITAPITNIVSQLHEHAEHHADKAQTHEVAVAVHTDLRETAKAEVVAARAAAEKFAGLVA